MKVEEEKKDEEKEDPKGIPEFWLTVFKNVDLLSEMLQVHTPQVSYCVCVSTAGEPHFNLTSVLQEHDEPILKHLQDIKVKFSDAGQPMVYTHMLIAHMLIS